MHSSRAEELASGWWTLAEKRGRRIGARAGPLPERTQRVNATIYKYTPHELQAAKGTLEWWTTIFSDPSAARRYWNVYSTLVSEPSVPVK